MDELTIPNPPTMKSRPKYRYDDEKIEAHRLWKTYKSLKHPDFEQDLTDHGKYLLLKYYGIRFK